MTKIWSNIFVLFLGFQKLVLQCVLLLSFLRKNTEHRVILKVINSVPYRPVRPEYTVPASNPVHSTPLFRTGKNTGRTGQFRAIPAGTEKSFFFFFFFLSFVIFEFLLG